MRRDKPRIEFVIRVVIESDENGFHAYCSALKGLHTWGDTKEEALNNAGDAAAAYIQSLIKHGDPIPVGIIKQKEREETCPPANSTNRHTADLTVACAIS